jgi:hypothetical protein
LRALEGWCRVNTNLQEGTPVAVLETPVYETPKIRPRVGRYERVLEPLMATPKEWAKIGIYKTSNSAYQAALNLRHGKYRIPSGLEDWEFLSDGDEVFAKYLGEPS